jgi:hypothetical protein
MIEEEKKKQMEVFQKQSSGEGKDLGYIFTP